MFFFQLSLTDYEWGQLKSVHEVLKPLYKVTVTLQKESLTPGEFFRRWTESKGNLSRTNSNFSGSILQSMKKREPLLLKNNIFLAGIYVDPSNRCLLSPEQREKAREGLYHLSLKINKPSLLNRETEVQAETSLDTSTDRSLNDTEDFDAYMDRLDRKRLKREQKNTPKANEFETKFDVAFNHMKNIPRESRTKLEDALESYAPVLQEAARVASALPPTQVSVERLFSSLKILKTDLRTRLKDDIIEAMLFLKTNGF